MKSIKLLHAGFLLFAINLSYSQKDLSKYDNLDGIHITSYWGDIKLKGGSNNVFTLNAVYTDISKKSKKLKELDFYVSVELKNKTLYITNRKPKGFESIDLDLQIPNTLFVEIKLIRGGNINVNDVHNGIEVNCFNGSVDLKNIGEYAFVNAANGEVKVNFKSINKSMPISLVTMNGGITVELPENTKREIRLLSRKNGYILSDFKLKSKTPMNNLNVVKHSKDPIVTTTSINGGGALLFLSTENGPITINKKS
ncbi:hypothetical protein D7030_04805 [Flavobacteriaceae bacterium AU392]|nr:hypothetical protein D1817_11280 [Flavobacteriaceae bacterium]RKM85995.1 hypothetical protein D7030_04805 [Flavobacteriaceae bacterium AU392]